MTGKRTPAEPCPPGCPLTLQPLEALSETKLGSLCRIWSPSLVLHPFHTLQTDLICCQNPSINDDMVIVTTADLSSSAPGLSTYLISPDMANESVNPLFYHSKRHKMSVIKVSDDMYTRGDV